MEYPKDQIAALKQYCARLQSFDEGGVTYLQMEGLRLPQGCSPELCDALLCPVSTDGSYPSRLYFAVKVLCPYPRNWNVDNARIGEKNWFAFSWILQGKNLTLVEILAGHLAALTREK